MKSKYRARYLAIVAGIGAAVAMSMARADVSLAGARVGGKDVPQLAKFYQTVFGLQETNRLQMGQNFEIMMNFGASVEAAKASTATQIIVMHSEVDATKDDVPHLLFYVSDVKSIAAAITAAGGRMDGEPMKFGATGSMLGFGRDPAGNRFELIQRAAGK